MVCFVRPAARFLEETGSLEPVRLATPAPQPDRERLRHLIIGSPEGVRSAIHSLHHLSYADQATWSQAITIPPAGILITPAQGEVMRYLVRYRLLE
ncbi:MAG: hypothetical protein ACFCVD_17645 [Nodosilinea sp.]